MKHDIKHEIRSTKLETMLKIKMKSEALLVFWAGDPVSFHQYVCKFLRAHKILLFIGQIDDVIKAV